MTDYALRVEDLHVNFPMREGLVRAVNGVSFEVRPTTILGLVGESGCGKSLTALSIMRLVAAPPARIRGAIRLAGHEVLALPEPEMRRLRGKEVSIILQNPMTSLNPVYTIGQQFIGVIRRHTALSKADAAARAAEMLDLVGISPTRIGNYPHEFSGGMRQRICIAIALACKPKLLIADEPTTALDVTIQAQVLQLIRELRDRLGTAVVLITHDLGVVAQMCDDVAVMYAGMIVERAAAEHLFDRPQHPYTMALMRSIARLDVDVERLHPIRGRVPNPARLPLGCPFHPRCDEARSECVSVLPEIRQHGPGHLVRCHARGGGKECP